MERQAFNPFLPLDEYIPDGEPHIFGGRVYHFGSHDREGGYTFCMEDYVTYSASVDDLTDWRYEGVIYRACQDPDYPGKKYMYAPDVVRGNDGKYYLYYCMSGDYGQGGYTGTIHVAMCEEPAGQYEYLGEVKNPDGTPLRKYVCFDPAVLNDDGIIRLYYGTRYCYEECEDFDTNEKLIQEEISMFGRTREEILKYRQNSESYPLSHDGEPDSIMGVVMAVLDDDMLTVKDGPRHIIPYRVKGTTFEEHPFFEAASMRRVKDKYYFVYSSLQNHELCYAVSDYPDREFVFGGTIVSNGDIGYEGRSDASKHNMTGTTHGSIIEIENQWYVFYHRLTHKSDYSRQACAEKIYINKDGSIDQVELTSCGLNPVPLIAKTGCEYPAVIACIITNGHMPHGSNSIYSSRFPNVSHLGGDRFIAEIENGTLIGYKYFDYKDVSAIEVCCRMETKENSIQYQGPLRLDSRSDTESIPSGEEFTGEGMYLEVRLKEDGRVIGVIELEEAGSWKKYRGRVEIPDGKDGLFFTYHGKKRIQFKSFCFVEDAGEL